MDASNGHMKKARLSLCTQSNRWCPGPVPGYSNLYRGDLKVSLGYSMIPQMGPCCCRLSQAKAVLSMCKRAKKHSHRVANVTCWLMRSTNRQEVRQIPKCKGWRYGTWRKGLIPLMNSKLSSLALSLQLFYSAFSRVYSMGTT